MADPQRTTIGKLEVDAYHPVYRRADNTTWLKLNEQFHLPAEKKGDGWVCAGAPARFDANEEVEVLHEASEQVA